MRRTWLIAHRGASAHAPESTTAAIRAAVRAGADMIELDVQMTRDGRLMIFHDERLERTTNGAGRVAAQTFAALKRLDAGAWFGRRFAGQRVLTVAQALRLIPARMGLNLELKRTARRTRLTQALTATLRGAGRRTQVLLSSFDLRLIRPWRALAPIALICDRQADASLAAAIRLGCAAWHPQASLVTRARVARAHAAGLRVHAWVVDEPARARRLLRCGVDGLFTNDPARLRGVLR